MLQVSKPRRNFVTRVKEWLDQRSLKSLLESLPGKDLKVLDIGGGSGWLAGLVRKVDPRVSLTQVVDLDDAARSLAEQSGHRYFCGRIEEFVTDERYDVILMLNLIEHVSDPRSVLLKAKGLLASTGRLYIKTPNFRSLDASLFRHANWGGYHCLRHFVITHSGKPQPPFGIRWIAGHVLQLYARGPFLVRFHSRNATTSGPRPCFTRKARYLPSRDAFSSGGRCSPRFCT